MTDVAADLSNRFAAAVERAAPALVQVNGHRRGPASGIVYRPEGVIVAAYHSVEWAREGIEVVLADGATLRVTVGAGDPGTEVAVLKVEASGLPVPDWADAAPRPGQLVLAVSRSEHGPRARHGIVAATGGAWRTGAGGRVDAYLETDIGLFAGYSGSLLVDASGAALGMNTAGLLRGTGVAVPPATLDRAAETVLAHGYLRRGYLGVGTMPIRLGEEQGLAGHAGGLIVLSVQPDTPASRAGILIGDVLLALDGHLLERPRDLLGRLDDDSVGRQATLRVLRAGEVRELGVTVGVRGSAS